MKQNKYRYVVVLQGNDGSGWKDKFTSNCWIDAKSYESETMKMRIIQRRILNNG